MYHYFYKIENIINGKFYYGIHSTNNIDDGYMGSGVRLNQAYKKYGESNFKKTILKYFNTREDAANYEMEVVNEEMIEDSSCYNIALGGEVFNNINRIWVLDSYENKQKLIKCEEYHKNRDRYHCVCEGMVTVIDSHDGKTKSIDANEYAQNKERYSTPTKGKFSVKDKHNKIFLVDKNNTKLISGEYLPIWKGRHHTEETKEKIRIKLKSGGKQKGVLNSQYGTCWVTSDDGKSIKINADLLDNYLKQGYTKGRIIGKKVKQRTDTIIAKIDLDSFAKDYLSGMKHKYIAKKYNISKSYVSLIAKRRNIRK